MKKWEPLDPLDPVDPLVGGHATPRMHMRPHDPAYDMLKDEMVSKPKVHRAGCYICEDMEFARMGLPLCSPCCVCTKRLQKEGSGHIAADDGECDDCGHACCSECGEVGAQEKPICTCDTPCCILTGADIGIPFVGVAYSCGSQHCPTHGYQGEPERGLEPDLEGK